MIKRLLLAALLLALAAAPAFAADPVTVSVASMPLWTSTGVTVSAGQHVRISASGDDIWTWGGGVEHGIDGYYPWSKPNTYDRFLFEASHGEMIGFVGADPYQGNWGHYYYDWYGEGDPRSGQNQWPGYLHVGESAMAPEGFNWTAETGGLLWLGFNDDAQSKAVSDNSGYIEVQIAVNSKPSAEAGPNQQVHWSDPVQLDGTASSDADGDSLTYSWEIVSLPEGSAAAFDDIHSPTPGFVADAAGTYNIKLVVADPYEESEPDYVVVDTSDTAPTADAGPDQVTPATGGVGTVVLDGSGSWDADGDPIVSYTWTWAGGTASGVNPEVTLPVGTNVVTLVVSDGLLDSPPDTAAVQVNRSPVAEAGPDIEAQADETRTALVTLDGTASHDPDSDELSYTWTWPGGSAAGANPTVELPQGRTSVMLVVSDGYVDSAPDLVTVFVKGLTIRLNGPEQGTIQDVIDSAQDWDTVIIGPGTYQECITLRGKQIQLISSDGANRTILEGDQSIFGCPLVTFDQEETPATVLDGFTLQGQVSFKGTGIYIHDCSPTIRNCVIRDCLAEDLEQHYEDGQGGAIWVYGTLGRPLITNCLIHNNAAASEYGTGGIHVCCGAEATVVNCTIVSNKSNLGAGGLYVKGDSGVLLKNSIIWGNTPLEMVADPTATLTVEHCNIDGEVWAGPGNISADPTLVHGALGNYYMAEGSPCRNAGGAAAAEIDDLAERVTRTDGHTDGGMVDIGYHYPNTPIYIQAARTTNARGVPKSGYTSGERVFYRVTYTVQCREDETRKVFIIVKIGRKKFKKRALVGPGDYIARVRCGIYTVPAPRNKRVTVLAKLKDPETRVLLGKAKIKTRVYIVP